MNGRTLMSNENSSLVTRYKLPNSVSKFIEDEAYKLPFFFFKDCAYGNEDNPLRKEMNPYFSHTFLLDREVSGNFNRMPWNVLGRAIHLPNNKMFRAHMTLQYPKPDRVGIPHNAHVDKPNYNHWVGLYYVNDSDGDTFFFDNDLNVIHKETPEKGKIILFDGKHLHSSSSPSKNVRFTLNINYEYN